MRNVHFWYIPQLISTEMPPSRAHPRMGTAYRQRIVLVAVISMLQAAALAVSLYASQWYWKQPYHNSSLTGASWVEELVYGHPERIRNCLRMHVHVFLALVSELQLCGLKDSRYISLKEKTAIFLYTCVTGLSIRHVGERFQRSNDTVSKFVSA
jgi:hypothetical protein